MKLSILVHETNGSLLVVDSAELLKYSNDYKEVNSLCLYKAEEVCAAFAAFIENGIQQRIVFDAKE